MKPFQHCLKVAALLIMLGCRHNLFAQGSTLPVKPDTTAATKDTTLSLAKTAFNLLSFTGSGSNGQNTVSWKTDSRSRFTDFELERSLDEISFTTIGHVETSGSTKTNSFIYADNKPGMGRNFYRLKMTDSSQRIFYSKIIAITYSPVTNLQVHFDSQSGTVGLTGIEPGVQYLLKVYNCSGLLSLQKTITASEAAFSISQLPHGLYVVYATDGTNAPVNRKIIW